MDGGDLTVTQLLLEGPDDNERGDVNGDLAGPPYYYFFSRGCVFQLSAFRV